MIFHEEIWMLLNQRCESSETIETELLYLMLRILFDPGNLNNEEKAAILNEKFKEYNIFKMYENREGLTN